VATVVWARTIWARPGQVFGTSRLFTAHGVTIASGVHEILPGLSFLVIATNWGTREVVLRQKAIVGHVELLTTGVVQVPHGAPHRTAPTPAFTTPTAAEGMVGAVSGTLCETGPGRSPCPEAPAGGTPATPARPRDPGERGALPAAA